MPAELSLYCIVSVYCNLCVLRVIACLGFVCIGTDTNQRLSTRTVKNTEFTAKAVLSQLCTLATVDKARSAKMLLSLSCLPKLCSTT